jgi:electron transfer flavoprotein beta subunit
MAARTKPLNVVPAVAIDNLTTVVSYSVPDAKSGCQYIDPENMDELVELLHNQSKVI